MENQHKECNELLAYYRNIILIAEKKDCKIDIILSKNFLYCKEAEEIIKNPELH